ncbi:13794_t:CDS:2 [Gigaspora margarita]|uniref:13794_t:CDS:1 n=1 Tax=Gigaspora margarita TaxID=4874 RepID=A0ABN7UYK7_GIGMA|nr:13794_t:CDS:2 [Gigaspora margarita]
MEVISLTKLQNFALNILKVTNHTVVQDTGITKLPPCPKCDKKILVISFELFTTLSCGHIYYRKCIKKKLLFTEENKCPFSSCDNVINPIFSERNPYNLNNKKRPNYSTKIFFCKKVKKATNRDDSPTLKKLIKELTTASTQQISSENTITLKSVILEMNKDSVNFHELNKKINNAKDNNQKTNQDDASNALVNDKIREHIPDQDKITEANL